MNLANRGRQQSCSAPNYLVINLNDLFPSLARLGTAVNTWLLSVALYLTLLCIDCVTSARQLHFGAPVFAVTLSVRVESVEAQLLPGPQIIYMCN